MKLALAALFVIAATTLAAEEPQIEIIVFRMKDGWTINARRVVGAPGSTQYLATLLDGMSVPIEAARVETRSTRAIPVSSLPEKQAKIVLAELEAEKQRKAQREKEQAQAAEATRVAAETAKRKAAEEADRIAREKAAVASGKILSDKVLAFAMEHKGKCVGNGECSTLADDALTEAGAAIRAGTDLPNEGDYVWGKRVLLAEVQDGKPVITGNWSDVFPGDIVQFRDVRFERNGSWNATNHHTAVVNSVSADGTKLALLHQNWNHEKIVTEITFNSEELVKGWFRIYHPQKAKE